MNVGKKRPIQLLSGCRHIQAALPLLLGHDFRVAGGRYVGKVSGGLALKQSLLPANKVSRGHELQPTFGSLGQTHAQPAHAALAAHTGCAGAEGVEGDGTDDQRQVEGEVYSPGYVHVYLHTQHNMCLDGTPK